MCAWRTSPSSGRMVWRRTATAPSVDNSGRVGADRQTAHDRFHAVSTASGSGREDALKHRLRRGGNGGCPGRSRSANLPFISSDRDFDLRNVKYFRVIPD